ncbi:MAG: hypothetical protein J5659_04240 [Clostridia bacterium]|nr:hypothetical protein [Clostridia bacterium]
MSDILKNSFKLFLSVLFATFASFMITISFAAIFAKSSLCLFYVLTQFFNIIVLITLVWQNTYHIGFKDSNMVRTGHKTEDLYTGFKIGIIAQIPWLIFLIVSFIFNIRFGVYRIINSTYWSFLTLISGSIRTEKITVLKMCDLGALKSIEFGALLLIVPIISGFVYILGYKGIDIFSNVVYKRKKGE